MKIGIIGQGFVGNAVYQAFKEFYDVLTYDIIESKCNATFGEVNNCEVIFICLPTPSKKDGSCDIDIVYDTIKKIKAGRTVVIKSTVPPGTCDLFTAVLNNNIVFNPEFLTAANAVDDFAHQPYVILGGYNVDRVAEIYDTVFGVPIILTTRKEAETLKYITNIFLATKVIFANEMHDFCKEIGVNYNNIIDYMSYDSRMGLTHWSVPGPDGHYGFGGACFPKDIWALIYEFNKWDVYPTLIKTVWDINKGLRDDLE